jgi:hypothetical protein
MSILINDILNLDNLDNVKIRFVKTNNITDPLVLFKKDRQSLLNWQFWNYAKRKSFKVDEIAIGFVKIERDKWLLFDISKITKDLNIFNGVGYEYETIPKFNKYIGRVVIEYKNKSQNLVRRSRSVINDCKVLQILEDTFDNDIFPGYENVNISWRELYRVIKKETWKTALKNQKGVYLIVDKCNGKMYVGSAYGKNMILGRWSAYLLNGHGGNKDLKNLNFDYIKNNFYYSILDIYKSTVDDNVILKRELWWKNTLHTKEFGYNIN